MSARRMTTRTLALRTHALRAFIGPALALLLVAACSSGGAPILANPTAARPPVPAASIGPSRAPDPIAVALPRDDRPHDRLTEWWYYTGHLRDTAGGTWGFEFVIFRAERGQFPVTWASHLALTDETGGRFLYDQRGEIGPQVDQTARAGDGYALAITGLNPLAGLIPGLAPAAPGASGAAGAPVTPWVMGGLSGQDRLSAESAAAGGFGLALQLAPTKGPALHDNDGYVDFGPAGGSYYYSRTRMTAAGTVRIGARTLQVQGLAWFDHQWGDFIAVGGGWDWYAVNLDDGTDITLSLVRDSAGGYPLVYGTLVDAGGTARRLDRSAFTVTPLGTWQSPRTGLAYPAGWVVVLPGEGLVIDLRPSVADQELDTRATTGVVYWEGSQVVRATRNGRALAGQAYVELTGYGEPTGR